MAALSEAVRPPLESLYRLPLANGVEAIPRGSRDDVLAWISQILRDADEETAVLAVALVNGFVRSFNVGGQIALTDLGIAGQFNLQDPTIRGMIDDFGAMLSNIDGDISLVRTTANELAYAVDYGRRQEMNDGELSTWLALYIAGRLLQRGRVISETEVVRWSRYAQAETYVQNGITYTIYRTAPELSKSGPCDICAPYEGRRFQVDNGLVLFDLIPQHTGCVCYWEPDRAGWELPEDVWLG